MRQSDLMRMGLLPRLDVISVGSNLEPVIDMEAEEIVPLFIGRHNEEPTLAGLVCKQPGCDGKTEVR